MKMDGSVANSRRIGQLLVVKQRDAIPVARWQGGKVARVWWNTVATERYPTTTQHVLLFCNCTAFGVTSDVAG